MAMRDQQDVPSLCTSFTLSFLHTSPVVSMHSAYAIDGGIDPFRHLFDRLAFRTSMSEYIPIWLGLVYFL